MRYQPLGRTGLNVSIAGLGCGGASRLGTKNGNNTEHAASLVRLAVELGVNYIDTARSYGTEPAVGLAMQSLNRDELVLSTKGSFGKPDKAEPQGYAQQIETQLNQSLQTLGVEMIDVYHIHGLIQEQITPLLDEVLPVLERAKQAGKIRHLAVSERFNSDPVHATLPKLMQVTDAFDVMMIGFNALNPSARQRVFNLTIQRNIGVEVMFAVRKALSDPAHLRKTIRALAEAGQVDGELINSEDPLGFLLDEQTPTLMDAAYRFCAHEPGCHTVLFGTGNPDHLRANIASLNKGPLSEEKRSRLRALFGKIDHITGQ